MPPDKYKPEQSHSNLFCGRGRKQARNKTLSGKTALSGASAQLGFKI
jgi:hypothetical protein